MPGFNGERHDHGAGGAGGTELKPEVVSTGKINNAVQVSADESIQSAIDSVASTGADNSGSVRMQPGLEPEGGDAIFDFNNDALPITVKQGVLLDIRRAFINPPATTDVFKLEKGAVVLGHGARLQNTDGDVSGHWFVVDDSVSNPVTTNEPAHVHGYPKMRGGKMFRLEQTGGAGIASCILTGSGHNAGQVAYISSGGTGGFVNDNTVKVAGSVNAGTDSVVYIEESAGNADRNLVKAEASVQVKDCDHWTEILGGDDNMVRGTWADAVLNATNAPVLFGTNAGGLNEVRTSYALGTGDFTNNSGQLQFVRQETGDGFPLPQNLSGKVARYSGQVATDDGTNAGAGEPCRWDGVNNQWVPLEGSAAFA